MEEHGQHRLWDASLLAVNTRRRVSRCQKQTSIAVRVHHGQEAKGNMRERRSLEGSELEVEAEAMRLKGIMKRRMTKWML
jgi:hypothetical protein